MATDGIFKVFSKQYVVQRVLQLRQKNISLGEISNLIAEEAIEQGVTDNVTLLLVDLRSYYSTYHRQQILETSQISFNLGSFSDTSAHESNKKSRISFDTALDLTPN